MTAININVEDMYAAMEQRHSMSKKEVIEAKLVQLAGACAADELRHHIHKKLAAYPLLNLMAGAMAEKEGVPEEVLLARIAMDEFMCGVPGELSGLITAMIQLGAIDIDRARKNIVHLDVYFDEQVAAAELRAHVGGTGITSAPH